MPETPKSISLQILRYTKKHLVKVVISILLAIITALLILYVPILVGNAIDCIVGTGNVDFQKMLPTLATIGIVAFITAVLQWIMGALNNNISYNIVHDIRSEVFAKIQRLPIKYIDQNAHGDIISKVINDAEQFGDGLLLSLTQFFTGIVTIFGTLLFMFSINAKIAVCVVLMSPISLFVAKFIASKTYHMFLKQTKTRGEQTALINETIGNLKVIKALSHEQRATEKFSKINSQLEHDSLLAVFFSSITNPSTRFVNSLVYAAVALLGAFAVINKNLTVGALTCFLSYATQYTKPFNEISDVFTELQASLACAKRVFILKDEIPEAVTSDYDLPKSQGNIDIENVSFSYLPNQKLLENVSLSVTSGQKIAIVGPTGCGKTTLINLLMRFYDVNAGGIKIDGKDIRDMTRKSLRKNFGMVLQETWIKSGTIRENIAFAKPDATLDEIIAAAKNAHAHSFIKKLPEGYDTIISENGGALSQGEKQLISIARVILTSPAMLILDEATSSIDTRTEIKIQKAFASLMEGRTSFIVAHRLSTIRDADVILVMNKGNIVEMGTHQELLDKQGFYYDIYLSQFAN